MVEERLDVYGQGVAGESRDPLALASRALCKY